jgi:hypothetical protein
MAESANDLSGMPIDHHKVNFSEHKVKSPQPLTIQQRVGYAILGLYIAQIVIGLFIHVVRVPFLFIFHRPPQNYFHAILGLVILAMAGYQVRLFLCRYHSRY